MRGRKPTPTALKIAEGNPGKRRINGREPKPPGSLPDCPEHLSDTAREEWHRIAGSLNKIGLLTQVDRSTMAAYCQCYGRWVEAEQKLKETPLLYQTQTGYVQQSPWLSVANKQLELMGRYMTEFGLTPASRSRVAAVVEGATAPERVTKIELVVVSQDQDGNWIDRPLNDATPVARAGGAVAQVTGPNRIYLDDRL